MDGRQVKWLIRKRRPFIEDVVGQTRVSKATINDMIRNGEFDTWEVFDEETGDIVARSGDKDGLIKFLKKMGLV